MGSSSRDNNQKRCGAIKTNGNSVDKKSGLETTVLKSGGSNEQTLEATTSIPSSRSCPESQSQYQFHTQQGQQPSVELERGEHHQQLHHHRHHLNRQKQPQQRFLIMNINDSINTASTAASNSVAEAAPTTTSSPACSTTNDTDEVRAGTGKGGGTINTDSMLSLSSIGFGIDSSQSAAFGDATDAAIRAVRDAMDRSSLRLPFLSYHNNKETIESTTSKTSAGTTNNTTTTTPSQDHKQQKHESKTPHHDALQIKLVLGVPAKQDGSGEPMKVDVDRLSSLLPPSISCIPIRIIVGGLYIPSENIGSPSVCTSVASITLQSQWPVYVASSPADAATATATSAEVDGPRHVAPSPVNHHNHQATQSSETCQCNGTMNHGSPLSAVAAATKTPSPSQMKSTTAASPPFLTGTGGPAVAAAAAAAAARREIRRNNSIEMLAMVAGEAEALRSAAATAATTMETNMNPPAALLPPSASSMATVAGIMQSQNQATQALQFVLQHQQQKERERAIMFEKDVSLLMTGQNPSSFSALPTLLPASATNGKKNGIVALNSTGVTGGSKVGPYRKMAPGAVETNSNKKGPRLLAKHSYTDHSPEQPRSDELHLMHGPTKKNGSSSSSNTEFKDKPSPNNPFPLKLHETLAQIEFDGYGHIISWLPHGRSFKIHKQMEFAEIILPRYFVMTKKSSFLRQLNLYGFNRFCAGRDQGSYYHELFLRGKPFLCRRMKRQKVNGNRIRSAGNPDAEPDLSSFPWMP
mmetsp:Transcript_28986/g.69979  ORF Transcript_28986/g.69979 Transcript_28986/m.69979 type:complete len:752 (+) Transcript_28986:390-2645(+)